jgi:hypothetical protein
VFGDTLRCRDRVNLEMLSGIVFERLGRCTWGHDRECFEPVIVQV